MKIQATLKIYNNVTLDCDEAIIEGNPSIGENIVTITVKQKNKTPIEIELSVAELLSAIPRLTAPHFSLSIHPSWTEILCKKLENK